MGLLSWLKTSDKVVDTAADLAIKGANGIDALFFTAEEKSVASLKMVELWIETQRVIRDENTARSITRRILAVIIMGFVVLLGLASAVLYNFNIEWATWCLSIIKEYSFLVGAVSVFYFGYYAVKQITGKK